MPTIGERLKELRDSAGMTQEQLAELLGTTGVAISRYEGNKRKPGCDVITKIAIAFQVSIESVENIIAN